MDGIICVACHTWLTVDLNHCPSCNTPICLDGENKNIIDRLKPNCLIYRYDGSDILEPAVIIKESKVNIRVATKLQEYSKPVVVAKEKVYAFDQSILSAIQALRNERTATIMRYDQLIQSHWQHLEPYE